MKLKDAKYFGVKLSPNRIKNDKGQLIVLGCEFARTGEQKYHSSELGVKGDKFIYLKRPVEEVSDPKTVASFEGAPVTLDHPEDDVKVGVNYDKLAKGFATNVKYIADSDKEGHLQADFVITNADLIKKIENHEIEELSAGYNCDVDEKDWVQRHIRGNHIAVVEQARAGHQARLRDKMYNLASQKIKTLKIGDKEVKIVDSYSYELEENGRKVKYTDYYTENASGKKKFVKTTRDSLFNISKSDANKIRQWWKDVNEKIYNGTVDMSTIDDPEAIEDWLVTMWDVLVENKDKKEYNDLMRKGKALYNKYSISKFNYKLTDDKEEDTIDDLIDDEREAVEGYEEAMKNSPARNKAVFSHIINEELEHIEELKGIKRFKSNDSTKSYTWKKLGEDWVLMPKGVEADENKSVITLSRMNKFFPWTVYKGNKKITVDANSDNLKDIKEYILNNIDSILGKKKSVKDETNPKNAILVKIDGKWKTWGGSNAKTFEEDSRCKNLIKKYGKENLKFVPNKDLDKVKAKDSKKKVKDPMYYWQAVNDDLHKKLAKAGYIDGRNFSTFTRPNKHLIIEAFSKDREGILKVLKSTKYNVVENDEWSGGNRIGIIIPEWYKEVDDDFKIKDSKLKDWTEEGDVYNDIIDRELFASLKRLGNGKYVILIDLNPKDWIYASSDSEAKKKFRQWLKNRNSKVRDSRGIYTIEVNNKIYCDDDGDAYTFNSYEEAKDFIEENGLDNAEVTRQYGRSNYLDEEIYDRRSVIDNKFQEIFYDTCFDISGFRNGNNSTEGSIYVVDINPYLDDGCQRYVEDNYIDDFDEEYLELACEYFEKLINNRLQDEGLYNQSDSAYVSSIDVGVTDWSGEEEFPMNVHIYCKNVTKE